MWPTLVAMVAVGGLYTSLPPQLTIDAPKWSILALVAGLLIPTEFFHAFGKHQFCKLCGYLVITVVTIALVDSVFRLVQAIPARTVTAEELLSSASVLWITNVLVFASWYWRLDAGGPHKRDQREEHKDGAFLFPQMTMELPDNQERWSPQFIDYLFLAFNTSTALSPTDVPVLSRWAKVMMMIQSAISLAVVVLLAARAVNIL